MLNERECTPLEPGGPGAIVIPLSLNDRKVSKDVRDGGD